MNFQKKGYFASSGLIGIVLHKLGYSLQCNFKTVEGKQHPDRNAQFEYINNRITAEMQANCPVISVDTKKKELLGNYKNNGQEWHQKDGAPKVNGHDVPNPEIPRAHPYGIYDINKNTGYVNIGTTHDTATFAVASIRSWWKAQGSIVYGDANRLVTTQAQNIQQPNFPTEGSENRRGPQRNIPKRGLSSSAYFFPLWPSAVLL